MPVPQRPLRLALALIPALLVALALAAALAARATAAETGARIVDFTFSPDPIVVTVGDTVTWTNLDRAPHTVQANGGAFNSGTLNTDQRFSYAAATAGTFPYFCNFHPYLQGTLIVEPADASTARFFPETGKTVGGVFLAYWQTHGGLELHGLPISDEIEEQLEDGNTYTVQYFERSRLEYHRQNAPPDDVLLGQFGRRVRPADPPAAPQPGARYFEETGHNLSGRFLDYWQANGGLAQFGFPIGEVFAQQLEDGNTYTVQYFERARFELHPENPPPADLLLGQFGRLIFEQR